MPVEEKAQLDEPFVDERERVEERPEQRGPDAMTTLKNDVDGELLEILSALTHR